MSEPAKSLLPGLLTLGTGILLMLAAELLTRPSTAPTYVMSALAIMCLCTGTLLLLSARRKR